MRGDALQTAEGGRRLAGDQTNAMLALPKRVGINVPTPAPKGKGAGRCGPAFATLPTSRSLTKPSTHRFMVHGAVLSKIAHSGAQGATGGLVDGGYDSKKLLDNVDN